MELKEISKDIYDVDAWLDVLVRKGLNVKKTRRRLGRNIMPRFF